MDALFTDKKFYPTEVIFYTYGKETVCGYAVSTYKTANQGVRRTCITNNKIDTDVHMFKFLWLELNYEYN